MLEETIREYLLKEGVFKSEARTLEPETKLIETGILDSLAVLNLVLFIEEKFALKVPPEEIVPDNFETLNSICRYVKSKQSSGSM